MGKMLLYNQCVIQSHITTRTINNFCLFIWSPLCQFHRDFFSRQTIFSFSFFFQSFFRFVVVVLPLSFLKTFVVRCVRSEVKFFVFFFYPFAALVCVIDQFIFKRHGNNRFGIFYDFWLISLEIASFQVIFISRTNTNRIKKN